MDKIRVAIRIAVLLSIGGAYACSSSPTMPSESAANAPTVYDAGTPGISMPTVVREVKPNYTADAIRNRIEGAVLLSAIVMPNGTVGDVTVIRSLDTTFGLDQEAVSAAKQWLFNPAMKDGAAVAIRVTIEMTFTLR